jgi:hypothetical protein
MKDGKVPVDLQFINAARGLIPRIEKVYNMIAFIIFKIMVCMYASVHSEKYF